MRTTRRRTGVAVAVLATGATIAGIAPASAEGDDRVRTRVTVHASDHHEVDPGEEFVLRGRVTTPHRPVQHARVRVQAYRGGGWHDLPGAVVGTNDDGRYRVRVVLFAGGDRDLRVVANPASDRLRTSRGYTVVRVLG